MLLVLLFVALWFILRGDLFYFVLVFFSPFSGGPGISLTLCCFVIYSTRRFVLSLALCYFVLVFFLVLLALRLPRLRKRELSFMLFVRLFDVRLFGFVFFLFLFVSGMGYDL